MRRFRPILRQNKIRLGIQIFKSSHLRFWEEHPALLSSLSILIGSSSLLFWGHLLWPFCWLLYLLFCRFFSQIFLLLIAIFYGWFHLPPSSLPQKAIGFFSPSSLQPHSSPFQSGLVYKGTLSLHEGSIPCSIYLQKNNQKRPRANRSYLVTGTLDQRSKTDFFFKPERWDPVARSWSFAEFRFQTKERFRQFLTEHLSSSRTATFLSSLITGDVEERLLRYEFSRLGLQHLLAISGFHFAVLIAFCSFCLNLFLSRTWKIVILFIAINAYFLFVGSSPAVQRSWLTALFFLLGQLINRPSNGLNLLGCALGVELSLNPLISSNLGFQLSFLSCTGILLFHPVFDRMLQTLFPKRTRLEIQNLTPLSRHGYLFSSFFRTAISLTLSVNLVLFPLLFFHFHQFPLLSLLYNLFSPVFVGVILFLLLIALVLYLLLPPLSYLVFSMLDWLTTQLLDLISFPPLVLDYSLYIQDLPSWLIPIFLFGLFNFFVVKTNTYQESSNPSISLSLYF